MELPDCLPNLLIRAVGNGAGIYDHECGIPVAFSLVKRLAAKTLAHGGAVGLITPAAKRVYEKLGHCMLADLRRAPGAIV
jgi:hypothetical protein